LALRRYGPASVALAAVLLSASVVLLLLYISARSRYYID